MKLYDELKILTGLGQPDLDYVKAQRVISQQRIARFDEELERGVNSQNFREDNFEERQFQPYLGIPLFPHQSIYTFDSAQLLVDRAKNQRKKAIKRLEKLDGIVDRLTQDA